MRRDCSHNSAMITVVARRNLPIGVKFLKPLTIQAIGPQQVIIWAKNID